MPEDGSKLVDVAALADAAAVVDLSVPLAGLQRLGALLAAPEGSAKARVGFAREGGQVVADVEAQATLGLRCQRCLGEFAVPLQSRSRVALVADESQVATLPEELEMALAVDGRLRLRELVEEELLLAVPAVPRHPEGQCAAMVEPGDTVEMAVAPAPGDDAEAQGRTQRPFAGLAELLGSQGSKK
jgi:uncharacterized protein